VDLVGTDVSEELIASSITLINDGIHSSETSVLTRTTRDKIPEDGILHGV
jgi:hypothetical protein